MEEGGGCRAPLPEPFLGIPWNKIPVLVDIIQFQQEGACAGVDSFDPPSLVTDVPTPRLFRHWDLEWRRRESPWPTARPRRAKSPGRDLQQKGQGGKLVSTEMFKSAIT